MKQIFLVLLLPVLLHGQVTVPIPPALTGNTFDLVMQQGSSNIFPGAATQTLGYNGAQLGPTLIFNNGETVTLNVQNTIGEETTTHWHGLHVAPHNDGSPHNPIADGATWSPSFKVLDPAATYWYHPHPHGQTMKQVLKGAAGFIIVRDETETALHLPRTYGVDDFPLAFQWKTFDNNNQITPSDEQDNQVLVNGVPKGATLNLPAQVVRLRLLNGSSHRYFNFAFQNNLTFKQIGGDGGLLNAPVSLTKLLLAPGERAEILVDLTGKEGQTFNLRQLGTQIPQGYPGGQAMMMGGGMTGPLDNTDFDLMSIKVEPMVNDAITTIPSTLITNTVYSQVNAGARSFNFTASPMMSMTNFFINGDQFKMETINFSTSLGRTEVWTLTNQTMMAHPFHVHGNSFYVLSVNGAAPSANMLGRKDVITVPPMGGQVKLVTRFDDFSDSEMPYMYHCHILSHEDNGMMGQFLVNEAATSTGEADAGSSCPICISSLPMPVNVDLSKVVRSAVFNAAGQLLRSRAESMPNGTQSIDISYLPAGTYFMEMFDREGRILVVQRFIKR